MESIFLYFLAWNNEQFAVYYGSEYEPAAQSINCIGGSPVNITSGGPRTVLMWNAEYNTYGNGSNINLTYKYSSDGTWKKYYNINDHLGNVRTVLRKDGTAGTVVKQFDYAPFGKVMCSSSNCLNRTKFIGKEKDKESNYADHGVRKYDDEIGRFTSIDPLWELDYSWTPYHYSYNNPVLFTDGNGMQPGVLTQTMKDISKLIGPAIVALGTNPKVQEAVKKATEAIGNAVSDAINALGGNQSYRYEESRESYYRVKADNTFRPHLIDLSGAGSPNFDPDDFSNFEKKQQGDNKKKNPQAEAYLKQGLKDNNIEWTKKLQEKFQRFLEDGKFGGNRNYSNKELREAVEDFIETIR